MKPRLTKDQRKALEAYEFAERQEDRYMGSVFVTASGQRFKILLENDLIPKGLTS